MTDASRLADPLLYLQAESLSDLERTRIAAANRLRQLTRTETDSDGIERGFGLDPSMPEVAVQAALVEALTAAEKQADAALRRQLKRHPLAPWITATRGIGPKQGARLLAAVGDPYWHTLYGRPRTVSELWAYSGLHTLPVDRGGNGNRTGAPDGEDGLGDRRTDVVDPVPAPMAHDALSKVGGDPQLSARMENDPRDALSGENPAVGQSSSDTRVPSTGGEGDGDPTRGIDIGARVAARRRRGQRANWNAEAKTRAYLVAESCVKQLRCSGDPVEHGSGCGCSPYRIVYDGRRSHTAITHPDWTAGHSHADGLRVASKAILRDLWRAARAVHESAGTIAA